METKWSETIPAKTERRLVVSTVNNAVCELQDNFDDADECIKILVGVASLPEREDKYLFYTKSKLLIFLDCIVRKAFGECGVIEVIINVLKAYINNADLCYNGCTALMRITFNGNY